MRLATVLILLAALLPAEAPADFVLLDASFDDKAVDAPIGIGGPDQGEPIDIFSSISATVRDAPFPTRSLELKQLNDANTGYIIFEFVGDASVDVGKVFVSFDIRFTDLQWFGFKFNEHGGWANKFCDIYTSNDGTIRLGDATGYYGTIGSYVADQTYHFEIHLDMDADTYDVYRDGNLLVDDRSHGITDIGVGRLSFRISNGTTNGTDLLIDDIMVMADEYTPAQAISLSDVKASF